MYRTIRGKLTISGIFVLLFILLMIISSQVVVGLFKSTSRNLVVEYNELDAIEELKMSLGNLLVISSSYVVYGKPEDKDYYATQMYQANEKLRITKNILTDSHDHRALAKIGNSLTYADSIAGILFSLQKPIDQKHTNELLSLISKKINHSINDLDLLLIETKNEIDDYVKINNTVIKHSTITMLSLGLVVILIIVIGGSLFIGNITNPIKELVKATRRISKGDRRVKVKSTSNDELNELAQSFNEMIDALRETTVSKNYLDSVLKNMFDALFVTDADLKIRSINRATLNLLQYDEYEIVGQDLDVIFRPEIFKGNNGKKKETDLEEIVKRINSETVLISKSGTMIPVLISSAVLKRSKKPADGMVIVGHDLTEKIATEQKIERIRKENTIALNEAQEEERMRIATDLHDGLGQMLTAISYAVQNLTATENNSGRSIHDPVGKIQNQIDATIQEAKNLAHNLIPIVLKDFGLVIAIENMINRANELYETSFSFNAYDFNERINQKVEKVLYRICQESLNNIVKHAHAKNASFQLFKQDDLVVLVVEDDGVGFNVDEIEMKRKENKSGIGLISINERVLSFNGEFTINANDGKGTELLVEIPCINNEQ